MSSTWRAIVDSRGTLKTSNAQRERNKQTTNDCTMPSSSVIKTASDALLAKRSVLEVGYRIHSNDEDSHYQRLLLKITGCNIKQSRRQSPLINAGYAVRMSLMSTTIQRFVEYYSQQTPCQIVILGCGLDLIGIWANSLVSRDSVRIIELDTTEICQAKRDLLLKNNLVLEREKKKSSSAPSLVLEGRIRLECDNIKDGEASNYSLHSCDLRDMETVKRALSAGYDQSMPTLVLSELVLAYLGQQSIDQILQWFAANSNEMVFVAYEPVGAAAASSDGVLNGFKQQYCRKFQNKLERGLAAAGKKEELFSPMGTDIKSIQTRFRKAGYTDAFAAVAGKAMTSSFHSNSFLLSPPEPFDEYASLALHLNSYALSIGFTSSSSPDPSLIRTMCPWMAGSIANHAVESTQMQVNTATNDDNNSNILITIGPIQRSQQEQVRALFVQTYDTLSREYSAVKKMVKTALKSDLATENGASIDRAYRMKGGAFLVATTVTDGVVVGCIGVRLLMDASCSSSTNQQQHHRTYEIQRLLMHSDWRRKGIAKQLMERVVDFCGKETTSAAEVHLVVTTPQVLESANHFYTTAFGFTLQKEVLVGNMKINTYGKAVL